MEVMLCNLQIVSRAQVTYESLLQRSGYMVSGKVYLGTSLPVPTWAIAHARKYLSHTDHSELGT